MKRPLICATLTAKHRDQIPPLADMAIAQGADLLELRADYLSDYEGIDRSILSLGLPIILTLRRREEGGRFKGSEENRLNLLLGIAGKGFKYVDIELSTPSLLRIVDKLKDIGLDVIISYHNFNLTPSRGSMLSIVKRQIGAGADVCKLVTKARDVSDNLSCLGLFSEVGRAKLVCFAMGELGAPSRILSPLFGAPFTYASVSGGSVAAPGQLPVHSMRKIYELMGL